MKRSNLNIKSFTIVPTKQETHYKCKVRFPGDGFSMRNSNTIGTFFLFML